MATSQIASMLDELMGRNRNCADANAKELEWSDAEVCRYYLVEFCPHDLFTNTKADLGACGKIHDDHLKEVFNSDKETYKKTMYVEEFLRFCQRMLSDLSGRIRKAKERLVLTQEKEDKLDTSKSSSSPASKEVEEKVILLSEKISALVQEAENAGCQGNVEEAQGLMKLCDQLRDERELLKRKNTPASAGFKDDYVSQQKAMEVCDVCGAFLIVGDAQQRLDDHLLGKLHIGYSRLRSAVERILDERRLKREEHEREVDERRKNRQEQEREVEEKRMKREKERESRRRRERSRDRRDRSRSQDRDRKRHRSRDKRRSRSRDRGGRYELDRRRSRSRHRGRSRSRDRRRQRKSRSSSRGHHRRRSDSREHYRRRSESRSRDKKSREHGKDRPKNESNGHREARRGPMREDVKDSGN